MAMARSLLSPLVLLQVVFFLLSGANATTTFTLINACSYDVWVGLQSNGGIAVLDSGGFALPAGTQDTVTAPTSWGGRFWGRTGCTFDSTGKGTCETGDCGGVLKCNGAGGTPPASLAEFTLNGSDGKDFYDISLVDGYNLPMEITPSGGTGTCGSPGCTSNLNDNCPVELQVKNSAGVVIACKSACAAFNTAQYCCTGAYASPTTCTATQYSKAFKAACPTAYSYAYDDASSTFTCTGANYAISFCPTGSSPVSTSLNGTTSSSPPPPPPPSNSQSPPPPSTTSSPSSSSNYSSGVRHTARFVDILLLSIAAFFTLHSKKAVTT